jgi:hypothetical protein
MVASMVLLRACSIAQRAKSFEWYAPDDFGERFGEGTRHETRDRRYETDAPKTMGVDFGASKKSRIRAENAHQWPDADPFPQFWPTLDP